jgi:hypothetical protein
MRQTHVKAKSHSRTSALFDLPPSAPETIDVSLHEPPAVPEILDTSRDVIDPPCNIRDPLVLTSLHDQNFFQLRDPQSLSLNVTRQHAQLASHNQNESEPSNQRADQGQDIPDLDNWLERHPR